MSIPNWLRVTWWALIFIYLLAFTAMQIRADIYLIHMVKRLDEMDKQWHTSPVSKLPWWPK